LKIGDLSHKVKKTNRKLAAKDKLASDQAQEIERLKELLAQKDDLLTQKELETQQEIQNKEQLLIQKDNEISGLNVQIQELSHIDFGIQMTGNEVSTQVLEVDLAGGFSIVLDV
jgi:hypothetical protein